MLSDIRYQIRMFFPLLRDHSHGQTTLGQGQKDQGTVAMGKTHEGRGKLVRRAAEQQRESIR